jgi:hypothetical protein
MMSVIDLSAATALLPRVLADAQVAADQADEPVLVTMELADGETTLEHKVGWVEPRATVGQWAIVRMPDGTETPVRLTTHDAGKDKAP